MMSDLNPAEDDQTTEVGWPHRTAKRRSSILKTRQPLSDLGGCDNDSLEKVHNKKTRRVSFSNKPEVREIPKVNYREPVHDGEAETMTAHHSDDASSALAVTSSATEGEKRSNFMASIQSLLLPPKMFNNQFGVYQLTDNNDFKTMLNTNQNKVVAVCRANLINNDTMEMTACHGNTSLRPPSAEEGLEVESVFRDGRNMDCTMTQIFNQTKVFGNESMEMTRCFDGLEGSFTDEMCFNKTILACRSDEDLDDNDEARLCETASGRRTMDDDDNDLEFGNGLSTNKAVDDCKMPFQLKSEAPRAAKDLLGTVQMASAGGQTTDEIMSKNHGGTSSASLRPLHGRAVEQERNPTRTILMGDDEGSMEMTACLSTTIAGGGKISNRTVFLEEDGADVEMASYLPTIIKHSERSSSQTVLFGEDDEMDMTRCSSKTIDDGGRNFKETLTLEIGQTRTNSLSLKDNGMSSIPTTQSVEHGVSNTCKDFNMDRTVFFCDGEDTMNLTDCITKTIRLDATALPPCNTNNEKPTTFGAGVSGTTVFGDDSRNEMSFTKCLRNTATSQAISVLHMNGDKTKIFATEGNGEDIEQTECMQANVFQNASQTYSNWDLAETRVFSESAIDALDGCSVLGTGRLQQSSMSHEITKGPPLIDVNAFLSVFAKKTGSSQSSGPFDETEHMLGQKKRAFPHVKVASEAAESTLFDALATYVPKAKLCRTPVVNCGSTMKAVDDAAAPESGVTALGARGTGAVTKQPRATYTENLVAVVTDVAPRLNSSSRSTCSSFAQDLSLASGGRAKNGLLTSGRDAWLGDQEVSIAPESSVLSSIPSIVPAGLAGDSLMQHPAINSQSDIPDLLWCTDPRVPLLEAMEEEDMDVDVTVNLTQVLSRKRSAVEHVTSVLQADKSTPLPCVRVGCPEDSTLLTQYSLCADGGWNFEASLRASEKLSDVDKSVNERIFDELHESKERRSLSSSQVDHHESNSLHTGSSSQPNDRLAFGMSEVRRGVSKSQSEQALVETSRDRSRHISLSHLGKFLSTGETSSNVTDMSKLESCLSFAVDESLSFESKGKRKRCVNVAEELLEKEPKRRGMSDADGKDGGMFGSGADDVEAAWKTGRYRELTSNAENFAQEMSISARVPTTNGQSFPTEQNFDSTTHCITRSSIPDFANTPIHSGKEWTSSLKLKEIACGISANPADITTVSVLFDRSRHLNRFDNTDCENVSRRGLLDMISLDRSSSLLEEPAMESMSIAVRNVPMFDSDDEFVERTQNRTDVRITSAFDLSKFELPEKWNMSMLDRSVTQVPLPKIIGSMLLAAAPSVDSNDKRKLENISCVPLVSEQDDIGKELAESIVVAEEPKTSQSEDKGDLASSPVIVEHLSESPENAKKRSSTKKSEQPRLAATKRPRLAVEEQIVFANEELRRIDEEVKQNLLVKGELWESLIVSLSEAQDRIPQIQPTDKFSNWDLDEWKSSGCSFTFLSETLVLHVRFGPEVSGPEFCGKPAHEISTLKIESYPGINMWPECKLAHLLIHEMFDASVVRLYRDTSQLNKVVHQVLVWVLTAERVKKDISDLDPLHIRCRVEIEGHRVSVSYSSAKARVYFRVSCDVHLPRQLDTCPAWTVSYISGHIREEEVLDQIKQVKPGFSYLGDVYRRIQTWLDTLKL